MSSRIAILAETAYSIGTHLAFVFSASTPMWNQAIPAKNTKE